MKTNQSNHPIDFAHGATNVYRTSRYIVRQVIGIQFETRENNAIVSRDTFYRRTLERDRAYEAMFAGRRNLNGKRLPATMCERSYIE